MKKSILLAACVLAFGPLGVAQNDVLDEITFANEADESSDRSLAEDASVLSEEDVSAQPKIYYRQFETATLRALDKITGRSTDIDVEADDPVVFGSLNVELKSCFQTPPELPPESAAFLTIHSTQAVQVENMDDAVDAENVDTVSDENPRLFSGWMYASSPGLSALEHPVYDIWVIRCSASAPEVGAPSQ
ncbi:MAG: DUF2155 domain-containing protein [Pseudomonadota bacterium]